MPENNCSEASLKPEILIVDDILEQLELIRKILVNEGFKLRLANSGEIALSSAFAKRPDLILLDIQMPGLDGYEVCRRLKADASTKDVPVIFLSALEDVQDKVRGFDAGAIDYITKPYQSLEVLERIKNHLRIFYMQQKLTIANQRLAQEAADSKFAEQAMNEETELLRTTFLSIGDGIICTDMKGKIVLINEVAKNLTGWYGQSAYGADFEEVCNLIDFHTRERIENPLSSVIGTGSVYYLSRRVCMISRDGIERFISDSIAPIKGAENKTIGCVMSFRDNAEEKIRKSELERLIYEDLLTGVKNHRYFDEEIIRLNAKEFLPLSLVIGDINGLRIVNDAFGHQAGDELILKTAQILKQHAGFSDTICRYGGDEFIVLMPCTTEAQAEEFVKKALHTVEQKRTEKDLFSISFGLGTKTIPDEEILIVLKNAEDDLYRNKMLENPSIRHESIQTILNTLFEKSPREEAHSKRVSVLAESIGKALRLSLSEVTGLKTVGLLHDIGKTVIRDAVLNKPGTLSASEWEEMKRHPEIGYRILRNTHELGELSLAVLQHHERLDGSGYPKGITDKDISVAARIIAIADSFDAMTKDRPYKQKISIEEALAQIKENAGVQFDPKIAECFTELIRNGVPGE